MATHKQTERWHTQGRAQERFGIQWSKKIRKAVLAQILSGNAELIDDKRGLSKRERKHFIPKRQVRYIVVIDGKEIVAAFDKRTQEICTLLPLEWCADKWAVERRVLLNQAKQRETEWLLADLKRQEKEIAEDMKHAA